MELARVQGSSERGRRRTLPVDPGTRRVDQKTHPQVLLATMALAEHAGQPSTAFGREPEDSASMVSAARATGAWRARQRRSAHLMGYCLLLGGVGGRIVSGGGRGWGFGRGRWLRRGGWRCGRRRYDGGRRRAWDGLSQLRVRQAPGQSEKNDEEPEQNHCFSPRIFPAPPHPVHGCARIPPAAGPGPPAV